MGDALQTLAFELLARPDSGLAAQGQLGLIAGLAKASGAEGMVLGQAQDMAAETAAVPLTLTEIAHLQSNKTGALIEWSATAGAVMVGADAALLRRYARSLGLAFQIADDILDVEGTVDVVGKATGKDSASGKATYVSLLGLEGAKRRAQELVDEACMALDDFGDRGYILKAAARFVVSRDL